MDFSIIIPAKNEEQNIAKCLASINAMQYGNGRYEVIVVDNGSSDRTVEVAKENGAQVFQKPDLTISGLRNYGGSIAKGSVLAFLDADCTVAVNWLTEASRYLDKAEVACFGGPPGIPADATWVQKAWFRVREKKQVIENVEWLESMNMFVPREKFASIGGFNEALVTCEDYDLSVRLNKLGPIVADQRIVAIHHGEAADLGHFFRKEHWRATSNAKRLKSLKFELQELPSLVIPPAYCLLALLAMVCLVLSLATAGESFEIGFGGVLVAWQLPLVLLTAWKTRTAFNTKVASQLFVLLNVYFFARGLAVFRWR